MGYFKVNKKEYAVTVQNDTRCVITGVDDATVQYVMTINELHEMAIAYSQNYAFLNNKITNDVIASMSLTFLTEAYITLDIERHDRRPTSAIHIPIDDFCRDVLDIVLNKKEKQISDKLPSIANAIQKWKTAEKICVLDGRCVILDANKEMIGLGDFKENKILAVSKCNLSLFEELYLVMPTRTVYVELIHEECINSFCNLYAIDFKSFSDYEADDLTKDVIENFDLSHLKDYKAICDTLKFKTVGKAKSNLDNFFDI